MHAARPPPARPHVGLNIKAANFAAQNNTEWGDDDAWDSASDQESPSPPQKSQPRPVPVRAERKSSTSSISYSFIQAPSPSSYPPKQPVHVPERARTSSGWTVIDSELEPKHTDDSTPPKPDFEADAELVVGDLEQEASSANGAKDLDQLGSLKLGPSKSSVLSDASKIVAGT